MNRRFGFLIVVPLIIIACKSSSTEEEVSPEVAFCNAVGDAISKCAGSTDSSCSSLVTDCSKLTSLLSPSLLTAATACMKTATCDGGGPLSCLGSSLGSITPTTAQQTFASDYCSSCSVVSGDACTSAFYPSGGDHGIGTLLLPFGDSLVSAVDSDCTSSSLGTTVCQSTFSTCVSASAAKALATSISTDSASCLVKSIEAGIANIGSSGDGGTADGGGMTLDSGGDAGVVCNDLTNGAPTIVLENDTGSAPAPTGGTISDGTYYLISLRAYGTQYAETSIKDTLVFSKGTQYDDISLYEGDTAPTTESAVYTAIGTTFTRSFTCPATEPVRQRSYSATDNTFTLYDETGMVLFDYVKQ